MTNEELSSIVSGLAQRMNDWSSFCGERHKAIDAIMIERNSRFEKMLCEVHAALYGNGQEGVVKQGTRHNQTIARLEQDVCSLKSDMDDRFKELSNKLGNLNVRVWKMALVVAGLAVGIGKGLDALIRSIL